MKLERRRFIRVSGLAVAGMAAGGGLAKGVGFVVGGGGDSPELEWIRERVASYAGSLVVRRDETGAGGNLHVVCEIADLERFAVDAHRVVPEGATMYADGNRLSFEHNGRRVCVENVLKA
ncbi:MAG: hypothetical protein K9N23_16000 [Akkermansiaceae bacterium]|nr:hypothetical protein [Akkermansiaceae bacterium]MCF7733194.1 hypothetical protein [Akkermansiaceae bacterium]